MFDITGMGDSIEALNKKFDVIIQLLKSIDRHEEMNKRTLEDLLAELESQHSTEE